MRKRLPREKVEEVKKAYYDNQLTVEEICNKYGIKRYYFYDTILAGEKACRMDAKKIPLEEKYQWWIDYSNGESIYKIAHKYGHSESVVSNYVHSQLNELDQDARARDERKKADDKVLSQGKAICQKTEKFYPPVIFCKYTNKYYYDITYAPSEDGLSGFFGCEYGSRKPHHDWTKERQVIQNEP